ncbi:MAG: peptide-methionine (S)-S-oxide reductase MsrA [Pseudomonadales bacterium]|jgi:peptide-methionine (S)-S-oxide reductase|tara:strand:- start:95 stop:727 length:633 start_codon:yes stop_codon:yes gene_type:complete
MGLFQKSMDLPTADTALPGREQQVAVPEQHFVNGHPLVAPFPDNMQLAVFGMGCFWGAERRFWEKEGVYSTAAGYAAGITPNPSYEEVCSGHTGHNEVVLVVYNPAEVSYEALLERFWESHNPTEGMRQGNDMGTQYRSGIYTYSEEQLAQAKASEAVFQEKLKASGFGSITTEIQPVEAFYYAEHYHQQYLAKVPNGYCGLGGTGVCYS